MRRRLAALIDRYSKIIHDQGKEGTRELVAAQGMLASPSGRKASRPAGIHTAHRPAKKGKIANFDLVGAKK